MPTIQSEMTVARSWIGTTEPDDVFNERFDRLLALVVVPTNAPGGWCQPYPTDAQKRAQALNYAIEESMRAQLSSLTLDGPASASADGNSYNNSPNITALKELWNEFSALKGTRQTSVVRTVRRIGR